MASGASNSDHSWSHPGAVILVVIGFMYRGLNYGTISSELLWSSSTARWAILGALIGGCVVYVKRLLQI
jgi:hypothetical protein